MRFLDRTADDPRAFWFACSAILAVKLLLAALLPLTGDESYFLLYARDVDWGGFYDHPPMVGWMLWLVEHIGSHPLVLRLPAIATAFVLAGGVYLVAREVDEARARLVALLLLLTPAYLINVLITSDTGLILFGFLSAIALHRALRRERWSLYILSGTLLGLAFLSKYFAVLLGIAYLALLPWLTPRQRWGVILLLLTVVPFGLLNMAWNMHNCWNHVMFNVFNRQGGGIEWTGPLLYVAMLVYLFALPAWYLLRDRAFLRQEITRERHGALLFAGILPLLVFLPVALIATIGLHWVLLFLPLIYPAYVLLAREDLVRSVRFMAWFGGLHAAALVALLLLPVQSWEAIDRHRDAVFYLQPAAFAEALEPFDADFHAMDSYSRAAVLSYYSGRRWSVFGTGSVHAREDDRLTDWRVRDGRDMLFVSRRHDIDRDRLTRWFDDVELHTVEIGGAYFDVALAHGFDFAAYHADVLTRIRDRYYDIPDFLPVRGCPFLERYFGPEALTMNPTETRAC